MFGERKREAEAQRDMAIEVAFHAILLANNGEQILDKLDSMVQCILDKDRNQYPYQDAMYVRDRILDKLKKTRGDKSYIEMQLDWQSTDQEEYSQALTMQLKANGTLKSIKQARDDYFHRLGAGYPEKEQRWRLDFKKDFGCNFY